MPKIIQEDPDDNATTDVKVERYPAAVSRKKLTGVLPQIAAEVAAAMSSASLHLPVFFAVPGSGDALVTFATPLDPDDEDWDRACAIVCQVVKALLGNSLTARELSSSSAGMKAVGVAEFCVEAADAASLAPE
jgi:hypothetical protein